MTESRQRTDPPAQLLSAGVLQRRSAPHAMTASLGWLSASVLSACALASGRPGLWGWSAAASLWAALVMLDGRQHARGQAAVFSPGLLGWRVCWGLGGLIPGTLAGWWWLTAPQGSDMTLISTALLVLLSGAALMLYPDQAALWLCAAGLTLPTLIGLCFSADLQCLVTAALILLGLACVLRLAWHAQQGLLLSLSSRAALEPADTIKPPAEAADRASALKQPARPRAGRTELIIMLSQELRTSLHGILGMSRLAQSEAKEPTIAPRLEAVIESSEQLLANIDDIFDLSILERGKLPLERAPFDLSSLAQDALDAVQAGASAPCLQMRLHDRLEGSAQVLGDAKRVRQVLLRLLSHACRLAQEHMGSAISLELTRPDEADAELVCMKVSLNDGAAPSAEPARGLGTLASCGLGPLPAVGGAGLGLAISREIARALGGDIHCVRDGSDGLSFLVSARLPPCSASAPTRSSSVDHEIDYAALRGLRVVLAEDHEINAILLIAQLEKHGASVEHVLDGRAAVAAALREQRPDLILMDCHMPEMDGFEATRKIRQGENERQLAALPIIAVTALALDADQQRCLAAGMSAHLAKPFSAAQLARIIIRALHSTPSSGPAQRLTLVQHTHRDNTPRASSSAP